MNEFEMTVPCIFGLESFVGRELKNLGLCPCSTIDGHVNFKGTYEDMIRANLWIRTGERVLIKINEFKSDNFDDFYQGVFSSPWSDFLPKNASIPISGHSINSKLSSVPKCKSIIMRAIADSLGVSFLKQDGPIYQIRFTILKDTVCLYIDSTGPGLHKRGYRRYSNQAPLKETIAAMMVMLSRWRYEDELCDPFCGSGTIAIEAAMYKRNIAPGLYRSFAFENFYDIKPSLVKEQRAIAQIMQKDVDLSITAMDIDPECVLLAKENAALAGVGDKITITRGDATKFKSAKTHGTIICNPPYGERLSDIEACKDLYSKIGNTFTSLDNWAYYILSSHDDFCKAFNKEADKVRKVYNGSIKCNIYQYFNKKEERKDK